MCFEGTKAERETIPEDKIIISCHIMAFRATDGFLQRKCAMICMPFGGYGEGYVLRKRKKFHILSRFGHFDCLLYEEVIPEEINVKPDQ